MEESRKSFVKSLFRGDILNEALFPYPDISPEESEQVQMKLDSIETAFSANLANPLTDTDLDYAGRMGLTGLFVNRMYKGFGFNHKMYTSLMEQLFAIKPELGITVGMYHNPCVHIIQKYASEDIKSKYLSRIADGEVASYALYEGEEHEDINPKEIGKTIAERPTDDNLYTINGEKLIVNGGFSKVFLIFAITNAGLTCFIADDTLGLSKPVKQDPALDSAIIHHYLLKMEGLRVPEENRIGEEGQGLDIAMELLNITRLNYAILALMLGKKALNETVKHKDYADSKPNTRSDQGVNPLRDFKSKTVSIASMVYEIESMVDILSGIIDEDLDMSLEAPLLKVYADKSLQKIKSTFDMMFEEKEPLPLRDLIDDMISGKTFTVDNNYLLRYVATLGLKEKQTEILKFRNSFEETNKKIIDGFKKFGDFANKTFSTLTESLKTITGESSQVEKSQKLMSNFNRFKKDFGEINKMVIDNSKNFFNLTLEGAKGFKEEMLDFLPNDLLGMTSIKNVQKALTDSRILFNLYINSLRQESRKIASRYQRIDSVDKESKDSIGDMALKLLGLGSVISRTDYILGKPDVVFQADLEKAKQQKTYSIMETMPKDYYIKQMNYITKQKQKHVRYKISFQSNESIDDIIDKLYSYLTENK
jgi:acyl-CoA dehydrogenase family protein 9